MPSRDELPIECRNSLENTKNEIVQVNRLESSGKGVQNPITKLSR